MQYTPPPGGQIDFNFGTKKTASELSPIEESLCMVRDYKQLALLDADTLGEIQTWINDKEKEKPGFTSWFRIEFERRFPEFDEWKREIGKEG